MTLGRRLTDEELEQVKKDWLKIMRPRHLTREEKDASAAEWDRKKRLEEGTPDDVHGD
jgi:hypothetical protein